MKFSRFVRACKKYKFTFALNTYGGLTLVLRPINTFDNIVVSNDRFIDFNKTFKSGVKKMKQYRSTH